MGRFQLADGRHITHAVNQVDDRFAYAFLQGLFANDIGICQRKQQRSPQRVDIHTQRREDFHHLYATPQQQLRIRMPLRLLQAIRPGFG